MIINLAYGYRLRTYDKNNWRLEKYREPSLHNGRAKDKNAKWYSCDSYFQSLKGALLYVYNHELIAGEGEYTLKEAIETAEALERRLEKVVVDGA